jgi:hypothetical protein
LLRETGFPFDKVSKENCLPKAEGAKTLKQEEEKSRIACRMQFIRDLQAEPRLGKQQDRRIPEPQEIYMLT